jgi:hypothetical protein
MRGFENSVASEETANERIFLVKDRGGSGVGGRMVVECRLLIMLLSYGILRIRLNAS